MHIRTNPRAVTLQETLQLARRYQSVGRLKEAERICKVVLRAQPENVDALHMLGLLYHQRGDSTGAEHFLRRVIGLLPSFSAAHNNLGIVLQSQGRMEHAVACYRSALALNPDYHDAHHNLGLALRGLGQHEQALVHCERSVSLKPDSAESHRNLAHALHAVGRTEEAVLSLRRAIVLQPDSQEVRKDLGTLLVGLDRFDEAAICYEQSILLKPDNPEAHNYLGLALQKVGKYAQAENAFRAALRLEPGYAEAHANLSMLLLLLGRFEEGWREFEWRNMPAPPAKRTRDALQSMGDVPVLGKTGVWDNRPHDFTKPLWRGESLENKVLLISMEFGFGDTIQFCRYVPIVGSNARVVLEVQSALKRLVSQLPGADQVVAYGDALPAFDFYCPLMSLPHILGTTVHNIPAQIPYLSADASRVAAWRARLAPYKGKRIGLAWAGNPALVRDRQRSIAFERLASLELPGVVFVSLQKGEAAGELRSHPFGQRVHDWTDDLADFAETAALIDNLDLVISVDTAVVHLAGALGKPVWLLNRFDTCWRWLLEREDSPWYPGLRQYRQSRAGDWESVLERVRDALLQWRDE